MESDVLISLNDEKSQKIAEVLANKTAKKILRYLTDKEKTVTDIAEELNIAINTADYNVKKLIASGLIEKKSYWWSIKGKKMPTYSVSNKRIIISPKSFSGKLNYLITFVATGVVALGAKLYQYATKPTVSSVNFARDEVSAVFEAAPEVVSDAGVAVMTKVAETALAIDVFTIGPIGWFIIGSWLAILLLLILSHINERRSKL
jgi:DNA-binding transcriptional ArsR family regulator